MLKEGRALNDSDFYLFQEGTHDRLSDVLGAHYSAERGGTQFAVWAPNARSVSVFGDFNNWQPTVNYLRKANAGIWQGFLRGVEPGARYKFHIESNFNDYHVDKADPFAFATEPGKGSHASLVHPLDYQWNDSEWLSRRGAVSSLNAPISIYEVHLGSWRRTPEGEFLNYRELAAQLIPYVKEMGFTHVEFLPVMEHPFYGSWGYQVTSFFAPTNRYGEPQDLMYLIDQFHANGIAVILDWVPSHFPRDEFSLGYFDGVHEYESADTRRGFHPDWNSFIFDYARPEVRSFLLSSALFWLDAYHADALRVDGVASMLYLDYSRKPGEWLPNQYGGNENIDAVAFLRLMNEHLYRALPDTQTIAEESTSWPNVSRPVYVGGLGFGYKWDMGWMHDTLEYMSRDPVYRKFHHGQLTFRTVYAFNENFVLPLSHDEVVYGKGSLVNKMPGSGSQKLAGLRLLFCYMYAQPGKKLIFMGAELAQWKEWNHDGQLDWALLDNPAHASVRLLLGDLNHLYRTQTALHEGETTPASFEWLEGDDAERNVLAFLRKDPAAGESLLVICNFSAVRQANYLLGVPQHGLWREVLNSDATVYGGSGYGNLGAVETVPVQVGSLYHALLLNLPPLAALYLKQTGL